MSVPRTLHVYFTEVDVLCTQVYWLIYGSSPSFWLPHTRPGTPQAGSRHGLVGGRGLSFSCCQPGVFEQRREQQIPHSSQCKLAQLVALIQVRLQHLLHILEELANDEQSGQHLAQREERRDRCVNALPSEHKSLSSESKTKHPTDTKWRGNNMLPLEQMQDTPISN